VQTNDGTWRSEAEWPPADKSDFTTALRSGSYTDTAQSSVYTGGYVEPVGGGSAPAAAGGATAVSTARSARGALTRTPAVSVR
jgi:uncharacterized protein